MILTDDCNPFGGPPGPEARGEAPSVPLRPLPVRNRYWQVVFDLVQLLQLSVTATALALYYLIYCYMQLVYYTLRSALYFHQADGKTIKAPLALLCEFNTAGMNFADEEATLTSHSDTDVRATRALTNNGSSRKCNTHSREIVFRI
ncbi:unnamed protein product [Diatraea saccharalis]|uniref:Uncharacterized protein n=1 Tax=Diatraea saccharalis TaxID=40085 RepID=A0A9N9WBP2_9NEOP|nr:unnamed protein product [Diatraea saccharalis]